MVAHRFARLVPRLRPHAITVFGEMSALAQRVGAVNLGQGFPDIDGPEELKQIARDAITQGVGNQYPPAHGHPDLRAAIAEHQRAWYGLEYDPVDEVVVATGASEAIASALLALVGPGDEVLAFEPAFDIYGAQAALAGAVLRTVPLGPAFRPDVETLAAAVTPQTRALLVNSPHNPTGTVFSRAELGAIAAIAERHDLIVLSDEVYEHLLYDDVEHVPFASLPGMRARTVSFGSGGKSFSFTGWKVGWAAAPRDLMAAVRVPRQHLSYVSSGPFQSAIAAGLRLPPTFFAQFAASLQQRRDLLVAGLRRVGLDPVVPQGTYFVVTDVTSLGASNGSAFAWALPEQAGVACIPVGAFCNHAGPAHRFVRWVFCKRVEVIEEAIHRLRRVYGASRVG